MWKKLVNPFKKIRYAWWETFSSGFAATVCGIILTIGIGQYNNKCEKEQFVRTSEIAAMNSINVNIYSLQNNIDRLQKIADTIQSVAALYPDSLAYCSDSHFESFCEIFSSINYSCYDETGEIMFKNLSNLCTDPDDVSDMSTIYDLFQILRMTWNQVHEIDSIISSIGNQCLAEVVIEDYDPEKALKVFFNNKRNVFAFQYLIPARLKLLILSKNMLCQRKEKAMKTLEIKATDFEGFKSKLGNVNVKEDYVLP